MDVQLNPHRLRSRFADAIARFREPDPAEKEARRRRAEEIQNGEYAVANARRAVQANRKRVTDVTAKAEAALSALEKLEKAAPKALAKIDRREAEARAKYDADELGISYERIRHDCEKERRRINAEVADAKRHAMRASKDAAGVCEQLADSERRLAEYQSRLASLTRGPDPGRRQPSQREQMAALKGN